QLVEVDVERRQGVGAAPDVVGKGCAPGVLTLGRVQPAEEVGKPADQVGLGEHDVDRCVYFQPLGQLLHALAEVLGQVYGELGLASRELGDGGGDDDAVDRRTRTVLP